MAVGRPVGETVRDLCRILQSSGPTGQAGLRERRPNLEPSVISKACQRAASMGLILVTRRDGKKSGFSIFTAVPGWEKLADDFQARPVGADGARNRKRATPAYERTRQICEYLLAHGPSSIGPMVGRLPTPIKHSNLCNFMAQMLNDGLLVTFVEGYRVYNVAPDWEKTLDRLDEERIFNTGRVEYPSVTKWTGISSVWQLAQMEV